MLIRHHRLLVADDSDCAKRALAFLVTHEGLAGPDDELLVLNIQPAMSHDVAQAVGSEVVKGFHGDEAHKVLDPIKVFLDRHPLRHRCEWHVGTPADEIVAAAKREKSRMIVMGTHGHGLVGSVFLGSVAQRVVAGCEVPVLLVK